MRHIGSIMPVNYQHISKVHNSNYLRQHLCALAKSLTIKHLIENKTITFNFSNI